MKKSIAASSFLTVLLLAACSSSVQPSPTTVPTVTFTVVPAVTTIVLPTKTFEVTAGLTPEGQPAGSWNGIPIMPGALTGEGDKDGYVFTIKASPQQIREFYTSELGKLGWQSTDQGNGGASTTLIFTNSASLTLTISILTKGDEALVLLAK